MMLPLGGELPTFLSSDFCYLHISTVTKMTSGEYDKVWVLHSNIL